MDAPTADGFLACGKGIASKLEQYGIYTMGDIARQSVRNEEVLYQLFGVNAELLIDHAWDGSLARWNL